MIKCCTLYSGSTGNAILIDNEQTKILIDAGVSGKKIEEGLNSVGVSLSQINAILISHEHSDHTCSVGYISKKHDIPVFASQLTWEKLTAHAAKINTYNRIVFNPDKWFEIGNLNILPFSIPHDAVEPCGFSVFGDSKKITIATDIGHMNNYLIKNMESSDLLLIESNHDVEMLKCGSYPWHLKCRILGDRGHLSNEIAAKTISYFAGLGMKNFLLGHLSKENNFPELAFQTVINSLSEAGITEGKDVFVQVAPRNMPSRVLELV